MHLTSNIAGRRFNNLAPTTPDDETYRQLYAQVSFHLLPTDIKWVIAPRPGFTNHIITPDSPLETWFEPNGLQPHGLKRSTELADGCIVNQSDTAIAFFTADCPLICLKHGESLAVLHGGYRCLIRSDPGELNLIEAAFAASGFVSGQTQAFIAYGIGPCCWIPEADKSEIYQPETCRHPQPLSRSLVIHPARSSAPGLQRLITTVDLYQLARLLLLEVGVPDTKISWDTRCTSCHRQDGKYVFWSHARHLATGEPSGRNFAAAWLNY